MAITIVARHSEQSHDMKRWHLGLGGVPAVNLLYDKLHKLAVGLGAACMGRLPHRRFVMNLAIKGKAGIGNSLVG